MDPKQKRKHTIIWFAVMLFTLALGLVIGYAGGKGMLGGSLAGTSTFTTGKTVESDEVFEIETSTFRFLKSYDGAYLSGLGSRMKVSGFTSWPIYKFKALKPTGETPTDIVIGGGSGEWTIHLTILPASEG